MLLSQIMLLYSNITTAPLSWIDSSCQLTLMSDIGNKEIVSEQFF